MRSFRLLFAALLGLLTVAAFDPAPASAAVPAAYGVRIACDAATGKVTTDLHITNAVAGKAVTAVFTVATAQAITATSTLYPPYVGQSTTVRGTVGANGTIDLAGYSRDWNPATYLSYFELVRLNLSYSDGSGSWSAYSATCYYDPRNTYSLTCGGVAGNATFALTVTGTRATAGGTNDTLRYPNRIVYRQYISQRGIGGEFTSHGQAADVSRRIIRDGDNWADPGIGADLSGLELFVDQIDVSVQDAFGNRVGGAQLVCDYEL